MPRRHISAALLRPPPRSTPFPYTTLFRSHHGNGTPRHEARRNGEQCGEDDTRHHHPIAHGVGEFVAGRARRDRKSIRLNSSHTVISYAVFCLKKKKTTTQGQ